MELKELTEDFEILIVAWLKSGDENATNLAYSLAKYAIKKQLPIHVVSNRRELLIDCVRTCLQDKESVTVEQQVDTYLHNKGN